MTLTLKPAVVGAVDPGATFPGGGRTVEFVVASGDDRGYFLDQPSIAFETGTTAGVLTANMRLGAYFEEKSIEIPSAPVGIGRLALARTLEGLELTMSGFDNTRTAGPFSCTFFDKTGAPVAPGTIRTDLSADLGRYFQTSTEGGVFQLRAVFPVTGDAAAVDAVDVEVGNAAGVSKARARLQ